MFNVRLASGHLYGKQLFIGLSLVVSLMASFVLSFFPLDVLDEIWDLIESVFEGFLTYSCKHFVQTRFTLYGGECVKVLSIATAFQEFTFILKYSPFTSTFDAYSLSSIS